MANCGKLNIIQRCWQSCQDTQNASNPHLQSLSQSDFGNQMEACFTTSVGNAKLVEQRQFGSWPRRNAVDTVMLEELQFEISRPACCDLIQTNYNAMACYDHVIPNLAMLANRKHGVHPMVTCSNVRTIERAKVHVRRNEMGLSETSCTHESQMPIYGTGSGADAGKGFADPPPPPVEPFYMIVLDAQFHELWVECLGNDLIPPGYVLYNMHYKVIRNLLNSGRCICTISLLITSNLVPRHMKNAFIPNGIRPRIP